MSERTKSTPLHHKVLFGLILGAAAGVVANAIGARVDGGRETVAFLADAIAHPIGQVFLRLLFLVVVPLVFASLAVGVAKLGDLRELGRIGARTMAFFFLTTAFSVFLGIVLMEVFRPGVGFDPGVRADLMRTFGGDAAKIQATADANRVGTILETANSYLDMILPRNILGAVAQMQMLPLIVFALLFGAALTLIPDERKAGVVRGLEVLGDAMVAIVGFAMKLAPAAVFCLVFSVVAKFGLELLQKLAFYVVLVLAAYLVQLLAFYPLLLRWTGRQRPYEFLKASIPVIVTAFSTSSSNATLPTSLRVAQQDLGIRPAVAGFVLPLGATMNMNGTALFEGALVLFVAQIFGVELSISQQVLVVLLCVFSAIGTAGVPGGSLPLVMIVMTQVGVPADGIAIVLGVDRLLDMGRTVINVTGDLVCASYIEKVEARVSG
jgi:DAACS family dicarboxylate/amino acid:cation (Na+ or H+) symporter